MFASATFYSLSYKGWRHKAFRNVISPYTSNCRLRLLYRRACSFAYRYCIPQLNSIVVKPDSSSDEDQTSDGEPDREE
jgi:hypothetical protein